jgi:hypothetical protein
VRSLARSGANPFQPVEIVAALQDVALSLQSAVDDEKQPQE